MSNRPAMVLKGQVLSVIALTLAFQPFTEACKIWGIGPARMRKYLPEDWTSTRTPRSRWFGDRLIAVERAYCDWSVPLRKIIKDFGISQGQLYKLAAKYQWPSRPKGRRIEPRSTRSMSPERRRYYEKLRRNGMPLWAAKNAAWKAAFGNSGVRPIPQDAAPPVAEAPAGSQPFTRAAPERGF